MDPGPTAHLWDEVVGHSLWFVGVALVMAAVAETMVGRRRPHVVGYLLAVAVGLTWASNAVGGGTEVFSMAVAIVAIGFGWRRRDELGVAMRVGFLPAVMVLGAGPDRDRQLLDDGPTDPVSVHRRPARAAFPQPPLSHPLLVGVPGHRCPRHEHRETRSV